MAEVSATGLALVEVAALGPAVEAEMGPDPAAVVEAGPELDLAEAVETGHPRLRFMAGATAVLKAVILSFTPLVGHPETSRAIAFGLSVC